MMKLNFNDMLFSFSFALDCVEHQLCGATNQHSKRVACISVLMGRAYGFKEEALADLAGCALLHDNALTEYISEEYDNEVNILEDNGLLNLGRHCVLGEKNIQEIPFSTDVAGSILYHHENADKSGPFKKAPEEIPMFAQIIHITDQVDVRFHLRNGVEEKYEKVLAYIEKNKGILFSDVCVELFKKVMTKDLFLRLQKDKLNDLLIEQVPITPREYSNNDIISFCTLFARIIDYKSSFTKNHSQGIAKKAAEIGKYYKMDEDEIIKLYFAGSVHDLGKLVIDNDVLEKPGRLTNQEYQYMKNHAWYTYEILSKIKGLEDITKWASFHHEKLNGTGYPFGKTGEELEFHERLLACLDIYQALTESRPYKDGFSHEHAMEIMYNMVEENMIDSKITHDIDKFFGNKVQST